jgi:hypothetical protein
VWGASTERTPVFAHGLPNAKYFGFDCEEASLQGREPDFNRGQISVARKIRLGVKIQRRRAAGASTGQKSKYPLNILTTNDLQKK